MLNVFSLIIILIHTAHVHVQYSEFIIYQISEFKKFWRSNKNDPLAARNLILRSICPQLFGNYVPKLALALFLASGVPVCKLSPLFKFYVKAVN